MTKLLLNHLTYATMQILNKLTGYGKQLATYPEIKSGSRMTYAGGTSKEIYRALLRLKVEIKNRKK